MSVTTIHSGGLITKDPDSSKTYTFDWDAENLGASVTITTSTWEITGSDSDLTYDNATILSGSRKTRVRLLGGTVGVKYRVRNRILTNETPAQTKDRSFYVLIEEK
jgi:hypothetical protein